MIPKFSDIVRIITLVRCLNSGQSIEQVSASAKMSPAGQIRGQLRAAGYKKIPSGKWVVSS